MPGGTFSLRGRGASLPDARSFVRASGPGAVAAASLVAGTAAACLLLALSFGIDSALFVLLMVALAPAAYAHMATSTYNNEIEARAPELFYDLAEQTKASGSIVKALKRVSRHEYGAMSDEVRRVLSEVEEEGYDIASALEAMAIRIDNGYIDRSVSIVKEALTTSSNLESILRMVAGEGRLALSLKKERRSGISSSIFVLYFTAIIFLAVTMLCLTSFVQLSGDMQAASGIEAMGRDSMMPYYVLSVSVALCTGLTIGEMRDSSVFGGFKDAAILLALTFIVYEAIIFPGVNLLGAYGL
jgi:flagellar protein FlaJ